MRNQRALAKVPKLIVLGGVQRSLGATTNGHRSARAVLPLLSSCALQIALENARGQPSLRSRPRMLSASYFASGVILVIFDPWIPMPAMSPFWPKMNANTPSRDAVVPIDLATPLSTTTTLGPVPISQPLLLSR